MSSLPSFILIFLSLYICLSLVTFKILLSVLLFFINLIILFLGVVDFMFILPGVWWNSWLCVFIVLFQLKKNYPLFFQIFFCPSPALGILIVCIWSLNSIRFLIFCPQILGFYLFKLWSLSPQPAEIIALCFGSLLWALAWTLLPGNNLGLLEGEPSLLPFP